MRFKIISLIALGFFILNNLTYTHAVARHLDGDDDEFADTTRRSNPDSLRRARAHAADSLKKDRTRKTDSVKLARTKKTDSLQAARKHITDSTARIRKYRESKHYKDSVAQARNPKTTSTAKVRTDSIQAARKRITDSTASIRKYRESKRYKDSVARAHNAKTNNLAKARKARTDSIAAARKAVTDSTTVARRSKTDSIKTVQKRRTDSVAKVAKYKASKRYADSVTIVRKLRADSIKTVQKAERDRIAAIRKHSLDSAKTARTKAMDSVKTVRMKSLDSIKMVRKAKTDSFAKAKKLKESLTKSKEKTKEEDKKIKLELKIKQKRQEWTNAKMLKKKWGPVRRFTQNSFTHYNYYYNAKKKMEEAETNMQRTRKENYDSLIGLYPFNPSKDSSLMSADMDTIIRKISVGIQIHDPRVKWADDLYLLLGQAYFYRGQYDNAAIAFRYIISSDQEAKKKKAKKTGYSSASKPSASIVEKDGKHGMLDFLKHKSVHNEAILWLAHTYTQAQQVENAGSILSLLESETKLPADLRGKMAIEKAFAFLTENNHPAAATQLAIAVNDPNLPSWLRLRATFILGQLQQNMAEHKKAAATFEKVLTYFPKIEMDFYSRKYAAFNKLQAGENVDDAMRPLKKVLTDGKYVSYYDQVYYVLGQLAVKANQNSQALTYFTKSVNTPRATKKQKATSYAAMGDVYYAINNYHAAKRSYDSAAKYSSGKETGVAIALQRSKGLEEISVPSKVIHDQDSLLALSRLSQREQQTVVRRYLRDLERKRMDSIARAESSGVVAAAPVETEADRDASAWYFGNPTLMQQGSAEFKRKWGNRPLADNWRRGASLTFASTKTSAVDDELDDLAAVNDKGEVTEETLLAKIPNTPQQKELSVKLEQRAYMQLAKAYHKLEDYNMAVHTLDTLNTRYPSHNYKEDELYLRYQIAMKQNKLDQAKMYADQLMAKFPNSQYASIVRPGQSESKQAEMIAGKTVSAYFDETYDLLLKHQYTEVLMRINVAKKQFDNPTYQKRFEVTEAMALAGSAKFDEADTAITVFLRNNPADSLTPWATTVKNYIKEVRNGGKPSWYKEGPYIPRIVDTTKKSVAGTSTTTSTSTASTEKLTEPSEPSIPADIPSTFTFIADTPHYAIIVLPGIDSRTSGLKKAVKDFNTAKYTANSFELLFDLYNIDQGVLVIKKLANAGEAKKYLADLIASDAMKDYTSGELQLAVITAPNYKKMFSDKDAAAYFTFYTTNYK
ncbi:MAG: Tetratricopeptide domain protein [Flavipsychrobacter sp.]|nr:Tetratricopeptide domain protein [Flavipsychrobacter sp.]